MTPVPPPWCLHWAPNGELEPQDRQDLLLRLIGREAGLTRHGLASAVTAESGRLVYCRSKLNPIG